MWIYVDPGGLAEADVWGTARHLGLFRCLEDASDDCDGAAAGGPGRRGSAAGGHGRPRVGGVDDTADEDSVKGLAVLVVTVAQQEAQGLHARAEVGGEIPRLLYGPVSRRVGGDATDGVY